MRRLKDFFRISVKEPEGSRMLEMGQSRNLYQTFEGFNFWLDPKKYLDKCIIDSGVFEPMGTKAIKCLLKPGDVAIDVGANIGYYSVHFSNCVGLSGRVLCFEPTAQYRDVLEKNIKENNLENCEVFDYGLSNVDRECLISVGDCSATLHWVEDVPPKETASITLKILDDVAQALNLQKLDFVKVDVDGHEPNFLEGAWKTIEKFSPVIMLEVSHEHYLDAGVTAWDFYDQLKSRGLFIYSEINLEEIMSRKEFLRLCGNFTHSANIFISKKQINSFM